ncbi:MAG: response regulator, partial [Candidatus Poribacteria bacterium]|nr:response regulator [Candidatus Poribacteria bacterium]
MNTVLVIDDDSNICWAFEQFFQDLNYTVLIASNSEDGLRLAAEHQPDLVLLDVQLPGMSGLEALQQFKSFHT